MEYITFKRYKGPTPAGSVNIPALSICEVINGVVYFNHKPVCAVHSDACDAHFAYNGDGNGVHRGHLTSAIKKQLLRKPNETAEQHQARWDKIWEDKVCAPYKWQIDPERWMWGDNFYTAPIEDLQHIAKLIGAKEVK